MNHSISTRGRFLIVAFVLMVTAGVYLNSLGHDFVWDDHRHISNNPQINNSAIWIESFTDFTRAGNFEQQVLTYRPGMLLSFALDFMIWGLNPLGFHLTNILLHTATTFLVIQLLLIITGSFRISLLAGAIFGVHPIHIEAVSWISGRTDILSCLFAVSSILFSLKSLSLSGRWKWLNRVGAWGCFVLALLVKETVIILPMLTLIALWTVWKTRRRTIVFFHFFPMVGIGIVFLAFRSPSLVQHYSYTLQEIVPLVTFIYGEYIRLLIFPFPLKALYSLPTPSFAEPLVMRSIVMLLIGSGLGIYSFKRNPVLWMGLSWIFISLLPTIALILYESISIMIGIALVAYSVFLFLIADQEPVRLPWAIAALFINIIIALASVAILILYRQSLTFHSTWALLITATVTGILLLPTFYGIPRVDSTSTT